MKPLNYEELTPGIRQVVRWLRENGFETTDSGDGITNVALGMEGALDVPHVFMVAVNPAAGIDECNRLHALLLAHGLMPESGTIQLMYDPSDGVTVIALYNIDDEAFSHARSE